MVGANWNGSPSGLRPASPASNGLPWSLQHHHYLPNQRAILPWWSAALLGIILIALAMLPGDVL